MLQKLKDWWASLPSKSIVVTVPLKLAAVTVAIIAALALALHLAHQLERAVAGPIYSADYLPPAAVCEKVAPVQTKRLARKR